MAQVRQVTVDASRAGKTLAAILRLEFPGESWNDIRRRIHSRRVKINDVVCVDDARRLRGGDVVEVLARPAGRPARPQDVLIIHQDQHLLVIDKPPGMECERRPEQANWSAQKRALAPTVVEALQTRGFAPRPVHRLDRDTSGLMLFALSPAAEMKLTSMFKEHAIERVYRAVVLGRIEKAMTFESDFVRDRGDGLRGSTTDEKARDRQHAITHVTPVEHLGNDYTIIECQLETGRTHQIRIHLAEAGHMLCGEKMYTRRLGEKPFWDQSDAPRHALHSARLELEHPITGAKLSFVSNWPADLKRWLDRLKRGER